MERNQELYVIVLSALVALIPMIGPYLAFIAAISLTYRRVDAGFGNVVGVMAFTWLFTFILLLLAFGLFRVLLAIGVL